MRGQYSLKLTGAQVDQVAALYRKGATIDKLAAKFGCSSAAIRNALRIRHVQMRAKHRPKGGLTGVSIT